jgi:hypothetical protein
LLRDGGYLTKSTKYTCNETFIPNKTNKNKKKTAPPPILPSSTTTTTPTPCPIASSTRAIPAIRAYILSQPIIITSKEVLLPTCVLNPENDVNYQHYLHKQSSVNTQPISIHQHHYRCLTCRKSFRSEYWLDKHIQNKHVQVVNNETSPSSFGKNKICLHDYCSFLPCIPNIIPMERYLPDNDPRTIKARELCYYAFQSCFKQDSSAYTLFITSFCNLDGVYTTLLQTPKDDRDGKDWIPNMMNAIRYIIIAGTICTAIGFIWIRHGMMSSIIGLSDGSNNGTSLVAPQLPITRRKRRFIITEPAVGNITSNSSSIISSNNILTTSTTNYVTDDVKMESGDLLQSSSNKKKPTTTNAIGSKLFSNTQRKLILTATIEKNEDDV